jgi:PTS system galactitol-specific IIC component
MITAMAEGGLWTTFLYVGLTKILSWGGLAIIGVSVLFGLIYVNKIRPKKQTSKL